LNPFKRGWQPASHAAKANFGLPPLRPFSRAAADLLVLLFFIAHGHQAMGELLTASMSGGIIKSQR
jgi:hypothetical protein